MFTRPVSPKQAAVNKANAAHSTGPRTAQGKAVSAQNAISHGLCSAAIAVHYWESQEEFDTMRTEYMAIFKPTDRAQRDLVDRLIDCIWRRNRAVSMETTLLNLQIEDMSQEVLNTFEEPNDGLLRVSLAFAKRHGEGVWDSLTRHITAAERGYQRAMRELRLLQNPDQSAAIKPQQEVAAEQSPAPETLPKAEKHEITKRTETQPQTQEVDITPGRPSSLKDASPQPKRAA